MISDYYVDLAYLADTNWPDLQPLLGFMPELPSLPLEVDQVLHDLLSSDSSNFLLGYDVSKGDDI